MPIQPREKTRKSLAETHCFEKHIRFIKFSMLFNSLEFIFLFLPLFYLLYQFLDSLNRQAQLIGLICISLIFYGYWRIDYLPILAFSLINNYIFSRLITGSTSRILRRITFITGVFTALAVLGYFKYRHFFMLNLSQAFEFPYSGTHEEIPIGISFYTFTAIAFLTDVYTKRIERYSALEYGATITYFPHLVAGPILFHHDTIPQLRSREPYRFENNSFMLFLFFFAMGLFKKTALADTISQFSDPIFTAVAQGGIPDTGQAWRAALCYTLQIYFDFSGYSDMAIGLACLFGIRIPVNFYSPYKARNISLFWQKWHISLGYFFRTYLYIPLGGNKYGLFRTLLNLFVVMLLCGLWHGAGWTFVVWGILHGCALIVHKTGTGLLKKAGLTIHPFIAILSTFLFVTFAWVIFRADSMHSAIVIIKGMIGISGGKIPWMPYQNSEIWMTALLILVWTFPNTHQIMQRFSPAILHCKPEPFFFQKRMLALQTNSIFFQRALGALAAVTFSTGVLFMLINGQSNYLYFDF